MKRVLISSVALSVLGVAPAFAQRKTNDLLLILKGLGLAVGDWPKGGKRQVVELLEWIA